MPAAFINRGNAYGSKRDDERAIQDFDQGIRLKCRRCYCVQSTVASPTTTRKTTTPPSRTDQAIRLNPSYAHAFFNRGLAYDDKKDFDRAIQDYTEAIRLNPSDAPVFFNRGLAYDKRRTLTAPSRTTPRPSDSTPAMPMRSTTGATPTTTRRTLTAPSRTSIRPSDSTPAMPMRSTTGATPTTTRRTLTAPSRTSIRSSDSIQAMHTRSTTGATPTPTRRHYDRAIQDYDQAIQLNPGFALHSTTGASPTTTGRLRPRHPGLRSGHPTDPSFALAYNNRGNAYDSKKEYDRAIQDYTEAIRLNPSYAHAFSNRGYIYFYLGKFAAAQSDFAMGLAASPTDAYGVLWLYLSTSRADHSAHAGMEANAAKVKLTDWPGPVIQMYLGKMTSAQLISSVRPRCREEPRTALRSLLLPRRTGPHRRQAHEAKRLFQQSIDTGVTSFVEYEAAQSELKRLQATPATGSH